jgi:hypothetical protein
MVATSVAENAKGNIVALVVRYSESLSRFFIDAFDENLA